MLVTQMKKENHMEKEPITSSLVQNIADILKMEISKGKEH